jgi:hypothetical protein
VREDELVAPVMAGLWFLAGTVGRLGKSSTHQLLFFLATVAKPSCAVQSFDLSTDCVAYASSALFPDVNLEEEITTPLTAALFAVRHLVLQSADYSFFMTWAAEAMT